ncbi:DUF2231 domain-containing protein [Gloeobacter kilaueensis]|uniref:DUF2231 domain-containing protein n=1 Tax=Gloeobacter kilaueensis (strain ATCC BAA-2537 / CCAP 1431/1 / ULC 316 / JS1) TaxID=1183438 RepID=U5QJ76_GLOK1|nr:DUF2231 domain-containing protein [Gloeobacter kilaueensis]AGY58913.1 hypothetical protein GKIL_2667 [Gloeobacter kilaueensis JS1]
MNPTAAGDLGLGLGVNQLPYLVPLHPTFVHLTIGLFIIAVFFDVAGAFYSFRKRLGLTLPIGRMSLFDAGWWNLVAAAVISFVTVGFGLFELLLAPVPVGTRSPWGLTAAQTMFYHGIGGILMLTLIVALAVWRGFQRYRWRRGAERQVQWSYVLASVVAVGLMYLQGELGAQMANDFGIHNTTVQQLKARNAPALRPVTPEASVDESP